MPNEIILRPLVAIDLPQVIDLLQDVSVYMPDVSDHEKILGRFFGQPHAYGCVAVTSDVVVGFGSLFTIDRIRGGRAGIIEDVVVRREFRGHGIGRLVIQNILQYAREKRCFKVTLEAVAHSPAENFYLKSGFRRSGAALKYDIV
jgi:GNAT superfamily N-acetyltransferase